MMRFRNLEECKAHYPIDSMAKMHGHVVQITGYFFDGSYWRPASVADGFGIYDDAFNNPLPIQEGDCGFTSKESAEEYFLSNQSRRVE